MVKLSKLKSNQYINNRIQNEQCKYCKNICIYEKKICKYQSKIRKYRLKIRKQRQSSSEKQQKVNDYNEKYKNVTPIDRGVVLDFTPLKNLPKITCHDEYFLYFAYNRCPRRHNKHHNLAPLCRECKGNRDPKCGWTPQSDISLNRYIEDQESKSNIARELWYDLRLCLESPEQAIEPKKV